MIPAGYIPIGGGYSYALHRVGLTLMNPLGREVYFQPGDNEAAICEIIAALDECADNKRDVLTSIALEEYFA